MQYMGGKSRIAKSIAEVIRYEVFGRQVKDRCGVSYTDHERERVTGHS